MSPQGHENLSHTSKDALEVETEQLLEVLTQAREEGFDLLLDLTAYEPELDKLIVRYQLASSHETGKKLVIKTQISNHYPSLPSVSQLFPVAGVLEREVFDLFGIVFEGHPQLTRLFLTEADQCFPLRKSFRLDRAGWEEVVGE